MSETFSNEAEQATLSYMMVDANACALALSKLTPLCFHSDAYGIIFKAMQSLATEGHSVNTLSVQMFLLDHSQSEAIDGVATVLDIAQCYQLCYDIETPIRILLECARNRATMMLGSRIYAMTQEGASVDAIQAFIAEQQTIIDHLSNDTAKAIPYQTVSFDDDDPPPSWYIDSILLPNAVVGVYGDSESGKSLVVIDWAMHTALGWQWRWHDVAQGHVVYIAAEGAYGLKFRMRAWCIEHSVAYALVNPYIHIIPCAVPLMDREQVALAVQAIKAIPLNDASIKMIVFDTLNRSMEGGEENNNDHVRDAINATARVASTFDCAAVTIHHAGKNGTYRGASAFFANVDTVIKVEQDVDHLVKVTCDKQKDGAPHFLPIVSNIKSVRHPDWKENYSAPVLVASQQEAVPQEVQNTISGTQLLVLLSLGRGWLGYTEWKNLCEIDGDLKKKNDKFKYAVEQLQAKKLAQKAQERYRLTGDGIEIYLQNTPYLNKETTQSHLGEFGEFPNISPSFPFGELGELSIDNSPNSPKMGAPIPQDDLPNILDAPASWTFEKKHAYYLQSGLDDDTATLRTLNGKVVRFPTGNPSNSFGGAS